MLKHKNHAKSLRQKCLALFFIFFMQNFVVCRDLPACGFCFSKQRESEEFLEFIHSLCCLTLINSFNIYIDELVVQ
jgi:hypothetical protein